MIELHLWQVYWPLSIRISPLATGSFGFSSICIWVGPSNSESQVLQKCFNIFAGSSFSSDAKKCLSIFGTSFDLETSSSVSSALTHPPEPCKSIIVNMIYYFTSMNKEVFKKKMKVLFNLNYPQIGKSWWIQTKFWEKHQAEFTRL